MLKLNKGSYRSLREVYELNIGNYGYLEDYKEFEVINNFFREFDTLEKCNKHVDIIGKFRGIAIPLVESLDQGPYTPITGEKDIHYLDAGSLTTPFLAVPLSDAESPVQEYFIDHAYQPEHEQYGYNPYNIPLVLRTYMARVIIGDMLCSVWKLSILFRGDSI